MAGNGNGRNTRRARFMRNEKPALRLSTDAAGEAIVSGEVTQSDPAYPVHAVVHRAFEVLAELERTLTTGPRASISVQQMLSALSRTLVRVDANVLGLEREAAQLRHFAYHDALTGLPNRTLLMDRLDRALAQAARQNRQSALLLLDLNGFKSVNDRFGHAVGDELLRTVALRLLASTRDADTAARYGGDEFIILLPDVESANSATAVAEKIHARLTEPFPIGRHSIEITACIGVAVYPLHGNSPNELIVRADAAMYLAKQQVRVAPAPVRFVHAVRAPLVLGHRSAIATPSGGR